MVSRNGVARSERAGLCSNVQERVTQGLLAGHSWVTSRLLEGYSRVTLGLPRGRSRAT